LIAYRLLHDSCLLTANDSISVYLPSLPKNAAHGQLRATLDPIEPHWHLVEVKSREEE
jgi:hypothetical protein